MATEITWYQENRVILATGQGELNLQEMVEDNEKIIAFIRQGERTTPLIHLIVDMRAMTKIPITLAQLRRTFSHLKEPALGWSVIVDLSPVVQFICGILSEITGMHIRVFPTFEEAVAFLASQDESIISLEMQPQ